MRAQIFLENVGAEGEERLIRCDETLRAALAPNPRSMERRGGGYRGMSVARLPETGGVRVEVTMDVRDAMGANLVNTAAESLRPLLEKESGGTTLMAILTNDARERLASASFSLPVDRLSRAAPGHERRGGGPKNRGGVRHRPGGPGRAVTHKRAS